MTLADINVRLRLIRLKARTDAEGAHWEEKTLYSDLLWSIAAGTCPEPQECAREALTSARLPFDRWYA